jgi:hypothetical protein
MLLFESYSGFVSATVHQKTAKEIVWGTAAKVFHLWRAGIF